MKCYIVLYSQEGAFLTFTKRELGYYSNNTNEINPVGFSIKNGPGQFAFPGGIFNEDGEPFEACLRKFTEKCGKEISFEFFTLNQSKSLLIVKNMVVNEVEYEILLSLLNTVPDNYHTLYLEFSIDILKQIQDVVANTNFAQANRVRIGIYNSVFKNFDEIFKYNPLCPLDDELFNCELWQIQREINNIKLLSQNKITKTYYEMILYLANDILNANILY